MQIKKKEEVESISPENCSQNQRTDLLSHGLLPSRRQQQRNHQLNPRSKVSLIGTSKTVRSSPRPTLKVRQAPVPATRVTITGATTYESVPEPSPAVTPNPAKKHQKTAKNHQSVIQKQPDCTVSSENYTTNEESVHHQEQSSDLKP